MAKGKLLVLLFLSLCLQGCKDQVLYSQLNEQEANQIVALLYSAGLPASKVSAKGDQFRVDIEQAYFADAMGLLQSHGLPKKRYASLGDVFAKEGFVSSPLEERARLNHALSEELSHTLSTIDGVIVARVHLAVPEKEHLAERHEPSSASVFVKHRFDVDLSGSTAKIKALVVDGVENLPYENVTVGLFAEAPPAQIQQRIEPASGKQIAMAGFPFSQTLLIIIAAVLVLFGLGSHLFARWVGLPWKTKAEQSDTQ